MALISCPVNRQATRRSGHLHLPAHPPPHPALPPTHAGPALTAPPGAQRKQPSSSRLCDHCLATAKAQDLLRGLETSARTRPTRAGWPHGQDTGLGHGPLQPPPCPSPQKHTHLPCGLKRSHASDECGALAVTAFAARFLQTGSKVPLLHGHCGSHPVSVPTLSQSRPQIPRLSREESSRPGLLLVLGSLCVLKVMELGLETADSRSC